MKIPALLLASLVTVSVAAQSSKPAKKVQKKAVKKAVKTKAPDTAKTQPTAQRDTVKNRWVCVACGMG
ncbi:hypothetical protein [Chryseobacterium sp. Leaf394]|uniref:MNIO class RiPP chryseobasin precursor ChrA n=1 Tax=Chryseobacterium sp. Leaf394 TaxID=1736361 RepID=UPI0006FA80EA|nr:hypothetical protein [Chryseobacterium sp. Leaf394]KQS91331.1 hypothetical protein ASG21_02275 [Chryseobacterium sp. Leaf394]